MKRPSVPTRMRDPAVTPVLVLKMSISNALPAPAGSTCPVSSAQSGRAAVMLPQFTLQSIAALSAASCANVLTMRRRFPSASSRAKNTLLPVGTIRPSPVICLLPARVPSSGRPIRWRSSSSRMDCSRGAQCSEITSPVDVPPRTWCTGNSMHPSRSRGGGSSEAVCMGRPRLFRRVSYRAAAAKSIPVRCHERPSVVRCMAMSRPDPITEELFRNAIAALGDEMVLTIYRTAYSGVLKNIMDYSAALCDAQGRLAAQGLVAAGPSLLDPGRAAGGAAALRRRHRRGRHPDQQRPLRRRDASAGHLHLQAAVRGRPADRLCRDDLPPHRCRRTRAGLQRVGQHRDLRRGPAHPAAEAVRARQAEHHAVPHDRPQRAPAGTRAGRHPQPARRLRDRRARHDRPGGALRRRRCRRR